MGFDARRAEHGHEQRRLVLAIAIAAGERVSLKNAASMAPQPNSMPV